MTGRGNLTSGEYIIIQTKHDYCLCYEAIIYDNLLSYTVCNYYSNYSNRKIEHNTQFNILLRLHLKLYIILFNLVITLTCKYNYQAFM